MGKEKPAQGGLICVLVPKGGLEPPRLTALPPQGSASTNSATWADSLLFLAVLFRRIGLGRIGGGLRGSRSGLVAGRSGRFVRRRRAGRGRSRRHFARRSGRFGVRGRRIRRGRDFRRRSRRGRGDVGRIAHHAEVFLLLLLGRTETRQVHAHAE